MPPRCSPHRSSISARRASPTRIAALAAAGIPVARLPIAVTLRAILDAHAPSPLQPRRSVRRRDGPALRRAAAYRRHPCAPLPSCRTSRCSCSPRRRLARPPRACAALRAKRAEGLTRAPPRTAAMADRPARPLEATIRAAAMRRSRHLLHRAACSPRAAPRSRRSSARKRSRPSSPPVRTTTRADRAKPPT